MSKFDNHHPLPDGCMIRTDAAGRWDVCWPNGRHTRGRAATEDAAKEAALAEHQAWTYRQWMRGSLVAGQAYKIPLT